MADLFQGLAGVSAAISQVNAVTGPGFMVSEEAGEPLCALIAAFQQKAERLTQDLERLGIEPPLGTTPGAQVYKPFLASIANDPVQGSNAVLRNFQQELNCMNEQVVQAMELYRATEGDTAKTISKIN